MSSKSASYRTQGVDMTQEQEQRIRRAMIELASAMNEVGCEMHLEHTTNRVYCIGEATRYRHSLALDVIRTKRIEVS